MSPPEMSYSPAYHQAQGLVGTIPSPLNPLEHPEPSYSRPLRSSQFAHDVSPRTSGPRGSHAHSPETSRRASRVGDEAVQPVTVANGSKEGRSRGSWQPSLMSGEQTRVSKRGGVPDVISSDGGQDALLMLVRLFLLEDNIDPLILTTHVVPAICSGSTILLRCLHIHLLRHHLRHTHLTCPSLFYLSIPSQDFLPNPTLRSPFPSPPHP